MNNKQQAHQLAKHYFRLLAEATGVQWDADNDAEIGLLVDAIIAAAYDQVDRANTAMGL